MVIFDENSKQIGKICLKLLVLYVIMKEIKKELQKKAVR